MQQINRLKVVLAKQQKTATWLAETLGKNEETISRWCINESQPSLETLVMNAGTLDLDVKELLYSTKEKV